MADPVHEADPIYPDLSTQPSAPEIPLEDQASDDEREKMFQELKKIEEEIATLRQVLTAKEQQASNLKKELGINAMGQLKAEINKVQSSQAYQSTQAKMTEMNEKVVSSEYYKKTQETLKSAGQATVGVFNTIGSSMSTKFSEMKNSPTFKSFEEKVEGVGTSIMAKVSGAPREGGESEATSPTDAEPVTKQPQHTDDVPM
uniref:Tumor protein D54 n=1 Tax=Phallusia mammillata TaxID=59560 RepID=A0A6F9DW01_9ASCI|nr:tumor protein D54 [Phallusia mammillata]